VEDLHQYQDLVILQRLNLLVVVTEDHIILKEMDLMEDRAVVVQDLVSMQIGEEEGKEILHPLILHKEILVVLVDLAEMRMVDLAVAEVVLVAVVKVENQMQILQEKDEEKVVTVEVEESGE
tara:strand:- start:10 stop:375 length:366 start_codon:yes stop_codon:yes gene_type:complete